MALQDTKELRVALSVVLTDLKKGLSKGVTMIKGFASDAEKALAKTSIGAKILSVVKPAIAMIGVALNSVASIALVVGRVMWDLLKIVTNVIGKIVSLIWSIVTTVLRVAWSIIKTVTSVLGKAFEMIFGWLAKIPKMLLIVAGAATGAVVGMVLLVRSTAKAGDEIAKMSQRTGMSVQFLSRMKHVLDLAGGSVDDLQTAFRGLSRIVLEGVDETGQQTNALSRLGVRTRDLRGRLKGVEQVFMEVVAALRAIRDPMLRAGLAQEVFGRSALNMLPMINLSAKAFKEATDQAERFGLIWTPAQAKAAERFQDSLTMVGASLNGLKKAFTTPLMTPLSRFFERMAELVATNKTKIGEWGDTLAITLGKAGDWVFNVGIPAVVGFVKTRLPGIITEVRKKLDWAWEKVQWLWDRLIAFYDWVVTRDWKSAWKELPQALEDVGNALLNIVHLFASRNEAGDIVTGPLTDALIASFEYVLVVIAGWWDSTLKPAIRNLMLDAGAAALEGMGDTMDTIGKWIEDTIPGGTLAKQFRNLFGFREGGLLSEGAHAAAEALRGTKDAANAVDMVMGLIGVKAERDAAQMERQAAAAQKVSDALKGAKELVKTEVAGPIAYTAKALVREKPPGFVPPAPAFDVTKTPEYLRLQAQIDRQIELRTNLFKAGYFGKEAGVQQNINRLTAQREGMKQQAAAVNVNVTVEGNPDPNYIINQLVPALQRAGMLLGRSLAGGLAR